MNVKIFYLTRSYYPYQTNGGALMRTGAVESLRALGWNVIVVTPNYKTDELILENEIWNIPFRQKHNQKLSSLFERLGIYEDYLDQWVEHAYDYLKNKINDSDIVFSSSGGELGMIKLGSLLKDKSGCRFVVNFRDPLNYGYMNGLKRDRKPHIGRESVHEKYIKNADLIVTSSQYYANILKNRFNYLANKIYNNYFGYVKEVDLSQFNKKQSNKLRIAYTGIMSSIQKPELLYYALKNSDISDDVDLYFIGDRKKYYSLQKINDANVHFIEFLPHDRFLKFMCENIDVGFVSLTNEYYGACVPSKIYEYINLGLPILGALPHGDGKDIINNYNFGMASHYNNVEALIDNMTNLLDNKVLLAHKKIVLNKRHDFSMLEKIKEVDYLLKKI